MASRFGPSARYGATEELFFRSLPSLLVLLVLHVALIISKPPSYRCFPLQFALINRVSVWPED